MVYKRIPTQIVVAAFHEEDRAETVLNKLAQLMKETKELVCTNAAIAKKDANFKVTVKELGKPGALKGMVGGTVAGGNAGAVVGGISLAILGPIGVAAGAAAGGLVGAPLGAVRGAAIGTVGKFTVDGMDKDKLAGVGDALIPGSSAVVLVFDEVLVTTSKFEKELQEFKEGTDRIMEVVRGEITRNLKQGNDLVYLFAVDEDGLVAMKMVHGAEADTIMTLILTDEAIAVTGKVATKDGVIAGGVVVTDDVLLYEVDASSA